MAKNGSSPLECEIQCASEVSISGGKLLANVLGGKEVLNSRDLNDSLSRHVICRCGQHI